MLGEHVSSESTMKSALRVLTGRATSDTCKHLSTRHHRFDPFKRLAEMQARGIRNQRPIVDLRIGRLHEHFFLISREVNTRREQEYVVLPRRSVLLIRPTASTVRAMTETIELIRSERPTAGVRVVQ
jgi:hypothetical protein